MAIEIPRRFVEYVLLGPTDDRRQLQDSPILGDVWIEFAKAADQPRDLLITPHKTQGAGPVARAIDDRVGERAPGDEANISYLQGVVAARLYFEEVLRIVVPMTEWWHSESNKKELKKFNDSYEGAQKLNLIIDAILRTAKLRNARSDERPTDGLPPFDRYIALAGLILWSAKQKSPAATNPPTAPDEALAMALENVSPQQIADLLTDIFEAAQKDPLKVVMVWQISLNRPATPALAKSVPAVKADAARMLFRVNCGDIGWAVVDSGIQGDHPAFLDSQRKESRIKRSFNFSSFDKIVNLDNLKPKVREARLELLRKQGLGNQLEAKEAAEYLEELAEDARSERPIHWDLVEKFVDIDPKSKPVSNHGTHVAGIIGANRNGSQKADGTPSDDFVDGMCPDIGIYDFRVLAPNLKATEFAVIAALQFIRYLNERTNYITIHGANLSLSIPHDVRNYACGRTPVCNECERLVESGVVVVAAAGNRGYHSFETKEGSYEGYAAFSVTDPGNADGVITVGATHRYSPHTYGVSFFSSRGPTGDGRPKPDLVAPGERIHAPIPDKSWGDLDGTSMAAPHVSGAAAMLMARYSELIGQPRRVKRILCESATDLGRERSFQGHGMLDVLRALQSI